MFFAPSFLSRSSYLSAICSRNSDLGSHSRLFPPPPTTVRYTVRALHFCREKDSALPALLDSRLLELLCIPTTELLTFVF